VPSASRLPPHASLPPVIAIDGPSASGKGTVAQRVAARLGFHYLDSGALYRLVTLGALKQRVALDDEAALARLAASLAVRFRGENIFLNQEDVTDLIRSEAVSDGASQVAALPAVRQALLDRQRAFREPPGLVADGRDMGSVVFPDAMLKIYLTADADERARRRYKQLIEKGMGANITTLLQDIRQRDARDSARAIAPLQKSDDASLLDTTKLSIDAAVEHVLARYVAAKRVP
jgi:cytidylate kinase